MGTMDWECGAEITFRMCKNEAVLSANPAWLRSLARLFSILAEEAPTSHYHLDDGNSLEEGSDELIVEVV